MSITFFPDKGRVAEIFALFEITDSNTSLRRSFHKTYSDLKIAIAEADLVVEQATDNESICVSIHDLITKANLYITSTWLEPDVQFPSKGRWLTSPDRLKKSYNLNDEDVDKNWARIHRPAWTVDEANRVR